MMSMSMFKEIFTELIDYLVERIQSNYALQIIPNSFLANSTTSPTFASILLNFLLKVVLWIICMAPYVMREHVCGMYTCCTWSTYLLFKAISTVHFAVVCRHSGFSACGWHNGMCRVHKSKNFSLFSYARKYQFACRLLYMYM